MAPLRDPLDESADLTAHGVQIGAVEKILTEKINGVEKVLTEKISALKLWGVVALVTGQLGGAVLTTRIGHAPAQAAAHFFRFFV